MDDMGRTPRYAWLSDEIGSGAIVVTASRRLARDLTQSFGDRCIAEGRSAWHTPPIHSWQDWVNRLLSEAPDPASLPRTLDPLSVAMLWERCLQRRVADHVLNFSGVVRQAVQAWQRLGEWNVPVSALLATAGTEDERLFASAAADYSDLLQENNWADTAGLSSVLAELVKSAPGIAPRRVVLAGFDRMSPSVREVLSALESTGCVVNIRALATRSDRTRVMSYADADAEHRAAGRWAREQLDADPAAKIAIVSPSLEDDPDDVARLIREGLVPGWQYGGSGYRAAANLSYGRRLADYPLISVALQWLRWTAQGLPGQEISVLLRSSCLGDAEAGGRSRIERNMREHPDRAWRQDDWLALFPTVDESADAKRFCEAVDAARVLVAEFANDQRPPTGWVQVADQLLEAAGWPGTDTLDSPSFQLVNRWRSLMNEFGRLDAVAPAMRWPEAVARINALALETIWQPERGSGSVAVLGLLEAYGMEFDGIWICGMDATRWPPPSRPLPFVSRQLQRERSMPDATPADTLDFAKRLFTMLIGAAPGCVLSWAETRQDAGLTASSLLHEVSSDGDESMPDPGWSAGTSIGDAKTIIVADDPVPPVQPNERVRGGSYTLQRQFVEPFSAFALGRLGIRGLEPFRKGLSPGARGIIIHNALHNLLAEEPAQADIAEWPDRERRIGSAVDAALEQPGRYADRVLLRLIGLEGRRLRRMLSDFADAELGRPSFSVARVEADVDYSHAGIGLGFRIDRLDRLPDGRLIVVDYKTGTSKTFVKQSGELKDLQLVAYADALDEAVGGLLFINVDSREIVYKGVGDGWDDSCENWDEMLSGWRSELHEAVAGLASGDAVVLLEQTTGEARSLAILSRFEELVRDR